MVVSSEEAEFSAMDVTADGNVAILGDNDGYLHVFDIRDNKGEQRGKDAELHNKRVNTLHVSGSFSLSPPAKQDYHMESADGIQILFV